VLQEERISELMQAFESAAVVVEGLEFWFARDLAQMLGYGRPSSFNNSLGKAMAACEQAGLEIEDHFLPVTRLVPVGSGAEREVEDFMLTRYAAYLAAQNADPEKEEVAFAQTYFAVRTRQAELIEQGLMERERLRARQDLVDMEKQLSAVIFERVQDEKSFAIIRSRGDQKLFGGLTTKEMKLRLGIRMDRALADFLPTITIRAKQLASEITIHNTTAHDLMGEEPIALEHEENNLAVREMLIKRGIKPELLPPAEDIEKARRRIAAEEKQLRSTNKSKNKS